MKIVNAYPYEKVSIGRQGEDHATQIRFGILDMITALGEGGTFDIIVTLPQNGGSYIAGTVDREQITSDGVTSNGNYLLWTVEAEDTALYGEGKCEVVYTNNGRSKTQIYTTMVLESLGNEETPDGTAGMGWFNKAMAAKAQVEAALAEANQRINEANAAIAQANDLLDNVESSATTIASSAAGTAIATATQKAQESAASATAAAGAMGNILEALNGFQLNLNAVDNSVTLTYDTDKVVS